jgi:hypothetical protein
MHRSATSTFDRRAISGYLIRSRDKLQRDDWLRHNTEQLNWYEFLKDFGQVAPVAMSMAAGFKRAYSR